jgi:hypothetical protein
VQARMVAIEEKIKQKDAEVAELKTLETQTRSGGSPRHKKLQPLAHNVVPVDETGANQVPAKVSRFVCGPSHSPDFGPHCIMHAVT